MNVLFYYLDKRNLDKNEKYLKKTRQKTNINLKSNHNGNEG